MSLAMHAAEIPPLKECAVQAFIQPVISTRPLRTRRKLPAVWMRAGTSKGLFIRREDLPHSQTQWVGPLLAAMGGDSRQLNGIGGATSTTSKVAVVNKSARDDADVDYTFAQVSVGGGKVDFSGNCGNMVSGVGPFAIQEGLVPRAMDADGKSTVRIFNTNTARTIVETISVDEEGEVIEDGDYNMPGLQGLDGREIKVAFTHPAGSMTGKLYPTGNPQDILTVTMDQPGTGPLLVRATLLDVSNPFVFVDAATLPFEFQDYTREDPHYLAVVESIRREAAVRMGLAASVTRAAEVRGTPKIAFLWPAPHTKTDIKVRAFSMGKPHPTLQLTGAVCLGAGVCLPGTVPNRLRAISTQITELATPSRTPSPTSGDGMTSGGNKGEATSAETSCTAEQLVRIEHASGQTEVEVVIKTDHLMQAEVESCTVSRTARRLFEGNVYFYL